MQSKEVEYSFLGVLEVLEEGLEVELDAKIHLLALLRRLPQQPPHRLPPGLRPQSGRGDKGGCRQVVPNPRVATGATLPILEAICTEAGAALGTKKISYFAAWVNNNEFSIVSWAAHVK